MYDLILLVFIGFVSGLNYVAIQQNYTELNKLKHYLDIIRQDIENLRTGICQLEDLIRHECKDIDKQVNNTKISIQDMVKKIELLLVKLDSTPKIVGKKNLNNPEKSHEINKI